MKVGWWIPSFSNKGHYYERTTMAKLQTGLVQIPVYAPKKVRAALLEK
jgi:hypothetical protein